MSESVDDLESAAALLDAPPVAESTAEEQRQPGNLEAIGFILDGARELLTVALQVQSLRVTLAPEKTRIMASVLAPVADKYGINLHAALGNFGAELAAVATAGPLLWAAYRGLDDELKAKRQAAEKPAVQPVDQDAPDPGEM